MNYSKPSKFIRTLLFVAPIVFFIFLVSQDLVITGQLEAVYNFKDNSPFIMPLAPTSRVTDIQKADGEYGQSIYDSPVYFDVRLPREFKKITIWLTYKSEPTEPVSVAAFYNKDEWKFEDKQFEEVIKDDDGWKVGRVSYDLTDKRYSYQKYQFMISLPNLRGSGRQVDIKEIKILAEK